MVDASLLEQNVIPVVGGICPRGIVGVVGAGDTLLCVFWSSVVAATNDGLIVVFHIADGVNNVDFLGRLTDYTLIASGGIHISFFTLFGGHHNHTVGSTGTIHCCS